ncbi:MAG: hypothetical protein WCC01_04880 [Acidimicrobiia bacterium]
MPRITSGAVAASAIVLVVSGIAAFVGLRAVTGTAEDAPPAITTTTAPAARFLADDELVLGQAALVPGRLEIDGGEATFAYDLVGLAPLAGAEAVARFVPFQGLVETDAAEIRVVFPDRWTLETSSGEYAGTTANPDASVARFDVPEDLETAEVHAVRLDGYRVRVPIDREFEAAEGGSAVEVAPGVGIRVLRVTEQATTTIVQAELLAENLSDSASLEIEGGGPGWIASVREAEGRPRWNLTFDGKAGSDPIHLVVRGALWFDMGPGGAIPIAGPDE